MVVSCKRSGFDGLERSVRLESIEKSTEKSTEKSPAGKKTRKPDVYVPRKTRPERVLVTEAESRAIGKSHEALFGRARPHKQKTRLQAYLLIC